MCSICFEPHSEAPLFQHGSCACGKMIHASCAFRLWIAESTPVGLVSAPPVANLPFGQRVIAEAIKCPTCRGVTHCNDGVWGVEGMRCATEMLDELRDRAWRRSMTMTDNDTAECACPDTYTMNRLVYYADSAIAVNKIKKVNHLASIIPSDVIADLCAAQSAALVWSRWEIDLATHRRFNSLHEQRDLLIRMLMERVD